MEQKEAIIEVEEGDVFHTIPLINLIVKSILNMVILLLSAITDLTLLLLVLLLQLLNLPITLHLALSYTKHYYQNPLPLHLQHGS
jgi:hypothetical protein